jgi:RHS repeat-associated protein
MGDIPVATLRPNGSSISSYYVHTDQLNAPRKITQPSSNTLAWRWDTEPFGTAAPNQNPAGLGTFVYNLRFPGQYYQAETGLNYNYFRDYDPTVGRYVESDPIGMRGGINTYAYAEGNPVRNVDPLGLWEITINIGAGLGFQFTLANNGGTGFFNGQWSVGGYAGIGEGFGVSINPTNTGCVAKGSNFGLQGGGQIGLGAGIEADAHVGEENSWDINATAPGTPLSVSVGSDGPQGPILTFGESAVVGAGVTIHF